LSKTIGKLPCDVSRHRYRHFVGIRASASLEERKFATATGDTQKITIPFLDENGNFPASSRSDSLNAGIPATGNLEYIVAISAVDKSGLKNLVDLRNWLIGGYLISLLIVFFTGMFFAARAMAPISDIRQKAEQISASDLHIRIDEGKRTDEQVFHRLDRRV
jgi:hypothetical protein